MTAATTTTAGSVPLPRGRHPVVRVARLQYVGWQYALPWPWGILALSFAANLVIFGTVSAARDAWTGGLSSIYFVQFLAYLQTFRRGFPFALGMSVTRRAYYLGVWLCATVEALASGAVLLTLRLVEDATGGWGVSLEFFGLGFDRGDSLVLLYLCYVVPFLLGAAIGACLGLVLHRWSYNGLLSVVAGLIVLGGAAVVVVGRAGWWREIGDWFAAQSAAALFAGWPLPFVAVLALLGYAVIRRATP